MDRLRCIGRYNTAVAFDIDESGAIDDGTADLIIIVHGDPQVTSPLSVH